MTDKHAGNEFGFDDDDMDALKNAAEEAEQSDAELEAQSQEVKDEYLKKISQTAQSDLSLEADEKPKKKTSQALVLGVSGVVLTLIVGVVGYFLVPLVLDGQRQVDNSFGQAPVAPLQSEGFGFSQDSAKSLDSANDFSDMEIEESDLFIADANQMVGEGEQVVFSGPDMEPVVAEEVYANDSSDGDVVIMPAISDEERMYDNILAEASVIDAPHEAIKIDRNVVNMELQVNRINRVEVDVAETRKSLSSMYEVIGEIRKQTASISKALENNSENNKALTGQIKALSETFDGQLELQKADIAAFKVELKNIASQKTTEKPAVAQAKVKPAAAAKPVVQARPVVHKPVTLPAPKPRPVVVKAPPTRAVSEACSVLVVSENWRVKGVTPSSAYVERAQDGQGLLLKAGVLLPGFGTVQSFNPTDRSVCTTSGIVKR